MLWKPVPRSVPAILFVLACSLVVVSASALHAQGPNARPLSWADCQLFDGVVTPTDLPVEGNFDELYMNPGGFKDGVNLISDSKPGDPDYNGGRWQVHALQFSNYQGALNDDGVDMNNNDVLDSAEEVRAAMDAGYASDAGVVKSFVCPVIKFPQSGQ